MLAAVPARRVLLASMAATVRSGLHLGRGRSRFDGSNGSDGQPGAPGALVRLEVPREFPAELIKVNVAGGAGGPAGVGGKAGQGGKSKGCLVYAPMAARTANPARMASRTDGCGGAVTAAPVNNSD
jgi:hypothetical protein